MVPLPSKYSIGYQCLTLRYAQATNPLHNHALTIRNAIPCTENVDSLQLAILSRMGLAQSAAALLRHRPEPLALLIG